MEAPERIIVGNDGIAWPKEDARYLNGTEYVLSPQWRDIDSAPKDGSKFLAFEPKSEPKRYECWWQDDFSNWEGWKADWDDDPNPTHWMPLPTPPKSERKDDG